MAIDTSLWFTLEIYPLGVPTVVQRIMDLVLSLQRLGSLLRHGFETWPRNTHMQWVQPKKKKNIYPLAIIACNWIIFLVIKIFSSNIFYFPILWDFCPRADMKQVRKWNVSQAFMAICLLKKCLWLLPNGRHWSGCWGHSAGQKRWKGNQPAQLS